MESRLPIWWIGSLFYEYFSNTHWSITLNYTDLLSFTLQRRLIPVQIGHSINHIKSYHQRLILTITGFSQYIFFFQFSTWTRLSFGKSDPITTDDHVLLSYAKYDADLRKLCSLLMSSSLIFMLLGIFLTMIVSSGHTSVEFKNAIFQRLPW